MNSDLTSLFYSRIIRHSDPMGFPSNDRSPIGSLHEALPKPWNFKVKILPRFSYFLLLHYIPSGPFSRNEHRHLPISCMSAGYAIRIISREAP